MDELIFLYLNTPYYNYKNFYFTFDHLYYNMTPTYKRKFVLFLYNAKRFKNNLNKLYNKFPNTIIEIIDIKKEDNIRGLILNYNDNTNYDYCLYINNAYLFNTRIENIKYILGDKEDCQIIQKFNLSQVEEKKNLMYNDIVIAKQYAFKHIIQSGTHSGLNKTYKSLEDLDINYLFNDMNIVMF